MRLFRILAAVLVPAFLCLPAGAQSVALFGTPPNNKIANRAWWLWVSTSAASVVADEEITQAMLHTGRFREANPLLGQTRTTAYPVMFAVWGLGAWESYRWKRDDDRARATGRKRDGVRWWYAPLVVIGTHGVAITWNLVLWR